MHPLFDNPIRTFSSFTILYSLEMDDSISLTWSRTCSHTVDENTNTPKRTSPPTSMNDLSQFLTRHSITPHRPSMSIEAHARDAPLRPPSNSHHRQTHPRRQGQVRRHSSSANLARVASLVEELISSDSADDSSPSSALSESTTSPSPSPDESISATSSYFNLTYQPSMGAIPDTEDMASRHQHGNPESHKSRHETRHGFQGETLRSGKPERVMKPIKMRRRSEKARVKNDSR